MNRNLAILLNLLIGISIAYSQTGIWSGDIEVRGTKIPIVFHLDENNPTVDSPAQGVKGIPVQFTKFESDSISILIPAIRASFNGKCKNNEIIGKFVQSGFELPLVLVRKDIVLKRPQTPKPPYPYSQEEVSFSNGDAVLKGTLTLPEGYTRKTPVLLMITGSGLQNRDEEVFNHKPFAVIADALARNGIASLRYDDRGFGESTGDAVNCTTQDLMYDALAGVSLLRQRFDKVGALGHSEGGTIALMLGADNKTDFIISLAGMAISGKETLLKQNRLALTEAGIPEKTTDDYCAIISRIFDNTPDYDFSSDAANLPPVLKQNLKGVVKQMQSPYIKYFIGLDLRDRLSKVKCPVLALNGTKDTQVFYADNLDALKQGLPHNKYNKIQEAEGLNHLFQHCRTGSVNEYAAIEETISPEILEIISGWIKSLKR